MNDNGVAFQSPKKPKPLDNVIDQLIMNDEYLLEQIRMLSKEVKDLKVKLNEISKHSILNKSIL